MSIADIPHTDVVYHKLEIKAYTCHQWDNMLKLDMKGIINTDPYNIEPLHEVEELSGMINTVRLLAYPLIGSSMAQRWSSRLSIRRLGDRLPLQHRVLPVASVA